MRGIGKTLSRLPAARAWIAGAAILAGAAASVAHAQSTGSGNGDETAMAIPRLASPGDVSGVALPQPLAPSDAARVRRIFALQSRGNMAEAAEETSQLTDPTLLGPILANRYLGRFHRATPDELIVWLERHADEPDAPAIYALLTRRAPKGMVIPPLPNADRVTEAATPAPAPEDADPRDRTIARNPLLDRTVAARAASGNDRSAPRLIAMTKGLSASYTALLRGEVAQALFTQNRDDDALEVASSAIHHTPDDEQVGLPGYIAGLAAWRMERMNLALSSFERAWRAPVAPSAMRAAAAFWAARASLHTRDIPGYVMWMKRASVEPRTFYGLLARQALGLGFGFQGIRETLAEADVNALAATSEGVRAFALLQVGEQDRAEAELRQLWSRAKDDSSLMRSVLLVASQAGLIDLAAQLADVVQTADGRPRDNLRFPVPRLNPRGGFKVDPALIYGLARVESNFNASAVSPVGARGLMQIMPVTAGYIANDPSVARRLHDPALNLDLGQRYVAYLADHDAIDGDLIRVLASYNAGPGSFARWSADIRDGGDPLLFIEAIPITETRNFVQHVLAYTWIYAARLHLPAPSLEALAAGAFPRFTVLDRPASITTIAARLH